MSWLIDLWWNFTLGCINIAKACSAYGDSHLPHSPRSEVARCAYYHGDQLMYLTQNELAGYEQIDTLKTADDTSIKLYQPKPVELDLPYELQLVSYAGLERP